MSQPLSALLANRPNTAPPDRTHQLLVAQRLAEAMQALHAAGGVIGNLDDHRVLVEPDGTVTLNGTAGAAPEAIAGSPAYTAPELQGALPGRTPPTTQHDDFALAVLLFQLLMAGNHPYAGQWVGGGNLPDVPKAIQLGLYAYGASAVTPPPGAPALSTLEPGLAELFKRSFAATSAIFRNRPTGAEWARALAAARQAGQAIPPPASTSSEPSTLTAPSSEEHAPTTNSPAPTSSTAPSADPDPAPQIDAPVTAPPAPLPGPGAGLTAQVPLSVTKAVVAPEKAFQSRPEAAPETSRQNPSAPARAVELPVPTAVPDVAPRLVTETPASPAPRKFSRRAILERAIPPDDATEDLLVPVQPDQSQGSVWGDLVGELRWLVAPDQSPPSAPHQSRPSALDQPRPSTPHQSEPSAWGNFVSEIRWLAESELHWLTDSEFWRRAGKVIVLILLFLIVRGFSGRDNDMSNPGARPAVVRATRVPATQTPVPRPTATSVSIMNNPTVASFGSNFDVADRPISSTGERFIANIRDKSLRLEAFGKDAHGKAMFNTAPAQGDFQFTAHVRSTTGQGEILIYVRKPDSGRTWLLAVNPDASTWGLYEESPWSNRLTSVIDHQDYSSAISREPLRTISLSRKGGRTSLLINGTVIPPRAAGSMPRIGGPVTVGIGAMIPEDPEDYDGESFVVTIDRVAMSADER